MTTYMVKWTIEIDAGTPEEAARRALEIQRDPESIATCFLVSEDGSERQAMIDLGTPDPFEQPEGWDGSRPLA